MTPDPFTPFDVVLRGYDRAQVEARLNELRRSLEALNARNEELRAERDELRVQLTKLSAVPTTVDGMSARLQQILRLAQQEADELRSRATANAAQVLALARAEADELLETAHRERESLDTQLEVARAELVQLQGEIHEQEAQLRAELGERRARAEAALTDKVEELRARFMAEAKQHEADRRDKADRLLDDAEKRARTRLAEAEAEADSIRANASADVSAAYNEVQAAQALQRQVAEQLTTLRTLLDRHLPAVAAAAGPRVGYAAPTSPRPDRVPVPRPREENR